jgi:hypothetical protein
MPKRSDPPATLLLSIELLRYIPRHGTISTSELHQQLKNDGQQNL